MYTAYLVYLTVSEMGLGDRIPFYFVVTRNIRAVVATAADTLVILDVATMVLDVALIFANRRKLRK